MKSPAPAAAARKRKAATAAAATTAASDDDDNVPLFHQRSITATLAAAASSSEDELSTSESDSDHGAAHPPPAKRRKGARQPTAAVAYEGKGKGKASETKKKAVAAAAAAAARDPNLLSPGRVPDASPSAKIRAQMAASPRRVHSPSLTGRVKAMQSVATELPDKTFLNQEQLFTEWCVLDEQGNPEIRTFSISELTRTTYGCHLNEAAVQQMKQGMAKHVSHLCVIIHAVSASPQHSSVAALQALTLCNAFLVIRCAFPTGLHDRSSNLCPSSGPILPSDRGQPSHGLLCRAGRRVRVVFFKSSA